MIVGANKNATSNQSNLFIYSNSTATDGVGGSIGFGGFYTGSTVAAFGRIAGVRMGGSFAGGLTFYSRDSGGTMPERMRIDSAGNVGIGTSSPGRRLDVSAATGLIGITSSTGTNYAAFQALNTGGTMTLGLEGSSPVVFSGSTAYSAIFGTGGAYSLHLATNNTVRATIDSSGNLLVGTTSASARLTVQSAGTTNATKVIQLNNSASTELLAIQSAGEFYTGTAAASPYNSTTGNAANTYIGSNGLVQRSTSSLKYKTDVQDATHGLAEVLLLRSVTYKGKNDGNTVFGGLIAEEVDAIGLTEFVQYAEDGSPDALAYGNMVSLLFKAIQEQQALIENLTTRLNALEGK
jgi:hypothetical protein